MSTTPDTCHHALDLLDRAIKDRPDRIYDDLVEAVRCIVRMRDAAIEERRSGKAGPDTEARLRQLNVTLSAVTGGEYPLVGIRRERIKQARDALAKVYGS